MKMSTDRSSNCSTGRGETTRIYRRGELEDSQDVAPPPKSSVVDKKTRGRRIDPSLVDG